MKSLPNPHPVLVHFPIALLVTALLFDVACLALRRSVWLDRAAVSLYGLGVLGAGSSRLGGEACRRPGGAGPFGGRATDREPRDWAFATIVAFIGIAMLRFEVAWRDRQQPILSRSRLRFIALALAVSGQWLLFETADRGARLVYRHGVAVGIASPISDLPEVSHERCSHLG